VISITENFITISPDNYFEDTYNYENVYFVFDYANRFWRKLKPPFDRFNPRVSIKRETVSGFGRKSIVKGMEFLNYTSISFITKDNLFRDPPEGIRGNLDFQLNIKIPSIADLEEESFFYYIRVNHDDSDPERVKIFQERMKDVVERYMQRMGCRNEYYTHSMESVLKGEVKAKKIISSRKPEQMADFYNGFAKTFHSEYQKAVTGKTVTGRKRL